MPRVDRTILIDKGSEIQVKMQNQGNKRMPTTTFDAIQKKSLLAARFPNMGKKYDNISPGLRGFVVDRYTVFYYPKVGGIDIVKIETDASNI